MSLLDAAMKALAELERLHGNVEPCDGAATCPCQQAIDDLRKAIEKEQRQQ